jgi:hypothetical protein
MLTPFRIVGMSGAAAAAEVMEKTAFGLFMNGEDTDFELQKWKRCASP